MSGGFSNPLVGGGGALVYPSIHSPNFTHNVSGWTINKDGSAEFNNIIIRNGQVISGTSLYYNGTPALGNLVSSIASSGGTDQFGNAYLAGNTAYRNSGGTFFACSIQSGQVSFQTAPAAGGPYTVRSSLNGNNTAGQMIVGASPLLLQPLSDPGMIIQRLGVALAAELLQIQVSNTTDLAFGISIPADIQSRFLINAGGTINWSPNGDGTGQVNMVPSKVAATIGKLTINGELQAIAADPTGQIIIAQNQSVAPGNPALQVISQAAGDNSVGVMVNGESFNRIRMNSNAALLFGSGSAAQDTTLYRSSAGILGADTILANIGGSVEVWNTLGPPGITGWTSDHGRYRLANDGCIEFDIILHSNAVAHASSITTYPNTLPVAYRPAFNRVLPLGIDTTITAGDPYPRLAISTAGVVKIAIPSVGAVTTEIGGTIHMPLD